MAHRSKSPSANSKATRTVTTNKSTKKVGDAAAAAAGDDDMNNVPESQPSNAEKTVRFSEEEPECYEIQASWQMEMESEPVRDPLMAAKDAEEDAEEEAEPDAKQREKIMRMMKISLGLLWDNEKPKQLLPEMTLEGVAQYIKSGRCRNIMTLVGAGISTAAGIPDFRSPGTGLYDNLQKYQLMYPQMVFDSTYFKDRPQPFYAVAKDIYPRRFQPTRTHYFLKMLDDKGLLLRHYTQNIDGLEEQAGLDSSKVIYAHGSFKTARCCECKQPFPADVVESAILTGGPEDIPICTDDTCGGYIKPDVVFFGEPLPQEFFRMLHEDTPKCDLLLIMGTSLVVKPFNTIVHNVPEECPRVLINLEEPKGSSDLVMSIIFGMGHGLRYACDNNWRDVFWRGMADDACNILADALGWREELDLIVKINQSVAICDDR